jgi:hypothetical protein
MKEKELNSWTEFEKEISELELQRARLDEKSKSYVSPLLFRGQANSTWCLKSTLETYTDSNETRAVDYFLIADRVRPQIETYTGKSWNVDWEEIKKWSAEGSLLYLNSFPAKEYMVYLRHYGFPSPLLDWTKSPFVAAYFAFEKIPQEANKVAIYAYIEWAGGGKSQEGSNPVISTLPVETRSHKRHFIQQSAYTICAAETRSGIAFSAHEKALSVSDTGENLLWKFTLPLSIRVDVLRKLDQMNINSLSLFDTKESLMSTVALRAFYLENK